MRVSNEEIFRATGGYIGRARTSLFKDPKKSTLLARY